MDAEAYTSIPNEFLDYGVPNELNPCIVDDYGIEHQEDDEEMEMPDPDMPATQMQNNTNSNTQQVF